MKNKTKKFLLIMLSLAIPYSYSTTAQVVKNFELANVMNDETVSLDTYPSCEGIVLIFTSNNCPYDEYYRQRMNALADEYRDRVPVLLVNSLTKPDESPENMAAKGKALNLSMPYLADKDQTLMASLDVRKTPEAFLLENDNGTFTIVYRGAIDDNAQVETDVRHDYLRDAIDIMLTNQKIATPEVRPVGCSLKRKS